MYSDVDCPYCGKGQEINHGDGCFLAETPEELNATCEFLYSRAMTSLTQVARMKRKALPDLRGQLGLPET